MKIPVFSLVSEKVVQGQGPEGQGQSCKREFSGPFDSREMQHTRVFISLRKEFLFYQKSIDTVLLW